MNHSFQFARKDNNGPTTDVIFIYVINGIADRSVSRHLTPACFVRGEEESDNPSEVREY